MFVEASFAQKWVSNEAYPDSNPTSLTHFERYHFCLLFIVCCLFSYFVGMGKTVITLSLILANPAPQLSDDDEVDVALDEHWGAFCPGLQGDEKAKIADMPKSRGTLVVCPVSLVGQWVSEAKSKMSSDCPLKVPYVVFLSRCYLSFSYFPHLSSFVLFCCFVLCFHRCMNTMDKNGSPMSTNSQNSIWSSLPTRHLLLIHGPKAKQPVEVHSTYPSHILPI